MKVPMKIFIFCFVVIFLSCNTKDESLDGFEKSYPNISLSNHYVHNVTSDERHSIYEFVYDSADCHEYITFGVHNQDFKQKKKGDVFFMSYLKRVKVDESITHKMSFDGNKDTLYSYFENGGDLSHFTCGKYYYLYSHKRRLLNATQIEYYKQHKDSLVKNGVNEIPYFNDSVLMGVRLLP